MRTYIYSKRRLREIAWKCSRENHSHNNAATRCVSLRGLPQPVVGGWFVVLKSVVIKLIHTKISSSLKQIANAMSPRRPVASFASVDKCGTTLELTAPPHPPTPPLLIDDGLWVFVLRGIHNIIRCVCRTVSDCG